MADDADPNQTPEPDAEAASNAGQTPAADQAESANPAPEGEQAASDPQAQPAGDGNEQTVEQGLAEAQSSVNEMREAVDEATGAEQAAAPAEASGDGPSSVAMPDFAPGGDRADRGIELLGDVDLDVSVELGRSEMLVEDVLRLGDGSVVELDKLAGDPVDVHVNGRLVARGEVLVLNDNFCIRVSEIVADLEEEAGVAQQQQASS
jgi:flagellar motor switch protein FliN/FliY